MATSDEQMSRHRLRVVVLFSSEPRTASETALFPRGFAARSSRVLSTKHKTAHILVTTYKVFFFNKNSSLICLFYAWENSEIYSPDLKKD